MEKNEKKQDPKAAKKPEPKPKTGDEAWVMHTPGGEMPDVKNEPARNDSSSKK